MNLSPAPMNPIALSLGITTTLVLRHPVEAIVKQNVKVIHASFAVGDCFVDFVTLFLGKFIGCFATQAPPDNTDDACDYRQ